MKPLLVFAFVVLAASVAAAGEIYGTVADAGKPVAAGVKIEISAAGKTYSGESADVTLAYFPGSYASLKEKPYYHEVVQNLMKTSQGLTE